MLGMAACTSEKNDKSGKPKAVTAKVQSAPYELLVVADKAWLKTGAGQSLVNVVESPVAGLPQAESSFRVTYINPQAFNGTFKTYANIVVAKVDAQYGEPVLKKSVNVYARPQVVLFLYAPDNASFEQYVGEHGALLLAELNANEFARERALLAKNYSGVVMRQARKQFGVSIQAPKDIDEVKTGEGFLWASAGKREFRQNICLYTLPEQSLTADAFTALRDSLMQVNIPGGRDGQWMETDGRTVVADTVVVNGQAVLAFRGLWDMRNDAMGGPFVCYVFPGLLEGRLLVAEGFVFAPEERKRAIVRQLEATLQTVAKEAGK